MKDRTLIVCAAIKFRRDKEEIVVPGARHYDMVMRNLIKQLEASGDLEEVEQGFITNRGVFLGREDAWVVAFDTWQIKTLVGGQSSQSGNKKLYSENLY